MTPQGFEHLEVCLEGEGALSDVKRHRFVGSAPGEQGALYMGKMLKVIALPGGMQSGLPSVSVLMELPDGRLAIGETSARMFVLAARAIAARYPEIDAD